MEYIESLRWLHTLPDFERTGEFADRPDLAPMRALLAQLGEPHRAVGPHPLAPSPTSGEGGLEGGAALGRDGSRPTIHIAGSKGKGSTSAIAEAVLRAAGLRVGTYISPHLHRYTERIRIDGAPCSEEVFAAAMAAVREAMDAVAPQFPGRKFLAFDALTAAAFVAFAEAGVDAQVVEVGLGGTLDSTNVFDATDVAAITPISLEHTAVLGSTIPEIAAQKAGIVTSSCTVVVAPQRESALDVIRGVASERGARVIEVAAACQIARGKTSLDAQEFHLKTPRATYSASLPLMGRHQLDNAATAIVACEGLAQRRGFEITEAQVRAGVAGVKWPARLEVLRRKPLVIIDGAHNGDSAKRMVAALKEYAGVGSATVVFGTLLGKDIAAMADAVAPIADRVIVSSWPHARAMAPAEAAEPFRAQGVPLSVVADPGGALEAAIADAGERGAVVGFGSLSFVAALREYLLGIESDMIRLMAATAAEASKQE